MEQGQREKNWDNSIINKIYLKNKVIIVMYLTQHLGNCPIRCDQFLGNYVSYTVSPGVSRVQCQ